MDPSDLAEAAANGPGGVDVQVAQSHADSPTYFFARFTFTQRARSEDDRDGNGDPADPQVRPS